MKRNIFLLIFSLLVKLSFAQFFSFPSINKTGDKVSDFIPKNWTIKDSATGDLNSDKLRDAAVVIQYNDTVTENRSGYGTFNGSRPRVLFVLFKSKTGYALFSQNNTFILRYGEGGMDPEPYDKITIENGILNINYQFVRGGAIYKFRYQSNALYLIGTTNNGVSGDNYEGWDFNFSTRKAKHTTGKIGEDKDKEEWKDFKLDHLYKLEELTEPFSIEIFPYVFI